MTAFVQWQGKPLTLDEQSFAAGIAQIKKVVGEAFVVTEAAEVHKRAKCIIPEVKKPSAFVYPGSVQEIQEIVKIANEFKLPLWTCSKGKNWGYGSATPVLEGSLMLVLERMNKIITVDDKLAYAVVEPGVTYRQLHTYLKEQNIRLWLDATDGPADGSVIGNALERGVGETPYGDHFENLCGMEVVLANGELVRTGGGPMENYQSWNTHKWGVGPYLDGLFSQSNYGIVTKAGLWLMPEPEAFLSCIFELKNEKDFPAVIDGIRRLQFNGALRSKIHMINDVTMFGILSKHPKVLLEGERWMNDALRAKLRQRYNLPPWLFAGGIYGSVGQVRLAKRLVKRELGRYGRLQFIGKPTKEFVQRILPFLKKAHANDRTKRMAEALTLRVCGKPLEFVEMLPHVYAIEKGEPSDYFVKHAYMKSRRPKPADRDIDPARDDCGGIWAGPMVPLEGGQVWSIVEMCRDLARKREADLNIALMVASGRSVVVLTSLFYDKEDEQETANAKELYFEICNATQQAGYQQYRTSTMFMPHILAPAPEFQSLANSIKSALDPNNILAPGKYGIG